MDADQPAWLNLFQEQLHQICKVLEELFIGFTVAHVTFTVAVHVQTRKRRAEHAEVNPTRLVFRLAPRSSRRDTYATFALMLDQ